MFVCVFVFFVCDLLCVIVCVCVVCVCCMCVCCVLCLCSLAAVCLLFVLCVRRVCVSVFVLCLWVFFFYLRVSLRMAFSVYPLSVYLWVS